jgi:hypothetical protein
MPENSEDICFAEIGQGNEYFRWHFYLAIAGSGILDRSHDSAVLEDLFQGGAFWMAISTNTHSGRKPWNDLFSCVCSVARVKGQTG